MFKTIVITKPLFFDGEADMIVRLLRQGRVNLIHIRKPGAARKNVERLLTAIPSEWHAQLVLHDHFDLAVSQALYGVHLNARNPNPPVGWEGSISRSCHTLQEINVWKGRCDYLSLSPIFDSVSKQGYLSAFTSNDIADAYRLGIIDEKVYALGGVTFNRIETVKAMGFGGAMILGDAWK